MYRNPDDNTWGLPAGFSATTHILKPPLEHLAYQEVNEHLCLRAAGALGMRVAMSEVMEFGPERAIVLERYDRLRQSDGTVLRVHQEDVCQALGVHPDRKPLLLSGPDVRLAPLYDIASVAPYPDRFDLRHMAMAMSVNGKFDNNLVGLGLRGRVQRPWRVG